MAGLGRKTFVAGAILTASQVQGYLQDQTIMVFASASARQKTRFSRLSREISAPPGALGLVCGNLES